MYAYCTTSPESSRGVAKQWLIIASAQKQTRQQVRVRAAAFQLPLGRWNAKLPQQNGKRLKKDTILQEPKGLQKSSSNFIEAKTHTRRRAQFAHLGKPIYKSFCKHLGTLQASQETGSTQGMLHVSSLWISVGYQLLECARKHPLVTPTIIRVKVPSSRHAGAPLDILYSSIWPPLSLRSLHALQRIKWVFL